jgi:peptidoglycan/LPS O-acetylase OafA/YrhL
MVDGDFFFWSRGMAAFGYTFLSLLFGATLLWAITGDSAMGVRRVLRSAPLSKSGKYSYALYLFHVPIAAITWPLANVAFDQFSPGAPFGLRYSAFLVTAILASYGAAIASWYLVEERILRLKSHFS